MDESETSTIARLLQKMDASPGFAGLGASVKLISTLGDDSDGDTREIVASILRDAALTAKLLRIANSSRNARGGRNIATIDQALAILGLNTVKSVAMSLALLGSLSHKPQSKHLHAEIVAAYFCGSFAYELTRLNAPRFNAQEAQVCGLMQNLGRMMATYYLFDEIEASRALQAEQNLAEDEAILRSLGTSFADMGAAIAKHWNLPDVLQNSLAPDFGKAPPRVVANAMTWQQVCSAFCHRATDALFRLPENREKIEIAQHIEYFRLALHLKEDETQEWIGKCLENTDTLLVEMSFPCTVDQARTLLRKASERVLDRLSADDRLTKQSDGTDGRKPVEVIQHVLRLIHDKCNFDRTLLCLVDKSGGLMAIAGVGRNASQVTARFRCHGPKPDLFRAIAARKSDVFIADTHQPAYVKLLPEWYHESVGARSFLALPLVHNERVLGLVYGDLAEASGAAPAEAADPALKKWRELLIQALLAGTAKPP